MTSDNNWESLRLRFRDAARKVLSNNYHGVAIITAHVMMDSNGRPIAWVMSEGKRIEPSRDIKGIIHAIVGEM